jgi:hypothetical protein
MLGIIACKFSEMKIRYAQANPEIARVVITSRGEQKKNLRPTIFCHLTGLRSYEGRLYCPPALFAK